MDYIETTIGKLAKYNRYLGEWCQKCLELTMENDELFKQFNRCKRTIELIGNHYYPTNPKKDYLETLLNEIYTTLRKINYSITDYEKSSIFSKEKTKIDLKKCLERTNYILEDFYDILVKYNRKNEESIPEDFNPPKLYKNKQTFLLCIKNQKYLPLSCENIFVNMVQYKDLVYYVETDDIFSFFYFYRTEECWFWSPPKKTDPEDIWIECPQVKIDKGYWTDKIIPPYMAEYIIWLDLFFPNIPEFYMKREAEKGKDENKETKEEEEKLEQNNKNCLIF